MKEIKGYRIWQIVYPIGIYYVISSVAFLFIGMLLGTDNSTYMLRQTLCACVTIPFLYVLFYRKDKQLEDIVMGNTPETRAKVKTTEKKALIAMRDILFALFGAATLGIALNNMIAMTPLMQVSTGYQESSSAFFGGGAVFELLGSGLFIPIAEELLFRGIVFKRLRVWTGYRLAITLSAFIFGLIHLNLVQFIYAGILGLFLAFLLEKTGNLWLAILGHMIANIIAIVRAETGWLSFSYQLTFVGVGFTLLMLLIAASIIYFMLREYRNEL